MEPAGQAVRRVVRVAAPPRKPESPLTEREMDLAASIQRVTEEIMLNIMYELPEKKRMGKYIITEAVVEALTGKGAAVGVDVAKLRRARGILDPFIGVERRTRPQTGGRVCAECEHFTDAACCGREAAWG